MVSRNKLYEDKMKKRGLKKVTLWLPEECFIEFKLMASICCDNKEYIPATVRSLKTGRLKGINQ